VWHYPDARQKLHGISPVPGIEGSSLERSVVKGISAACSAAWPASVIPLSVLGKVLSVVDWSTMKSSMSSMASFDASALSIVS
jgi:hypothetical protein